MTKYGIMSVEFFVLDWFRGGKSYEPTNQRSTLPTHTSI